MNESVVSSSNGTKVNPTDDILCAVNNNFVNTANNEFFNAVNKEFLNETNLRLSLTNMNPTNTPRGFHVVSTRNPRGVFVGKSIQILQILILS